MISVVCVYDDEQAFNMMLNKSLQKQTAKFELISLNNIDGTFKSAAQALNHGGRQARGEYITFAHQDVILPSKRWLEDAEKFLTGLSAPGVAGCVGVDENGHRQGFLGYRYHLFGEAFAEPRPVQTLDESVLIIPKAVFGDIQFDEENFTGWHCYGADYCLRAKGCGPGICVIPNFIYHNSPNLDITGLFEYQKTLFQKRKSKYKHIYTTSGSLSSLSIKARPLIEVAMKGYVRVFPQLFSCLGEMIRRELSGCTSVLDIGWGRDFPIQSMMGGLESIKLCSQDAITMNWNKFKESLFCLLEAIGGPVGDKR